MQTDTQVQIDPDQSIGQQIDRIDRTIQNQQFLVQSLIKSFLKNSSTICQDDSFKKELNQINQRYEDINEQIILDTSTFSAYDTAFSQIRNRLNRIENQLNKVDEKEEKLEEAEKDLLIENMKVDIECLKEQFTNISGTGENSSARNTISILKTAFMSKFKKMKNHLKAYQESTNKAISSLRADLENLEMSGQEYHQEFTRLNSKIQNFQITLNYLRDQMNIPDDQISSNGKSNQFSREIESLNKSIESIQQKCVLREDAQDYENKVNSIKEKLAQFPLITAQQDKCTRDILNLQGELTQLKNSQFNSSASISADYQSKFNSIIESQQKSDETLRKTRKVVSNLKSELEQLKQSSQSPNGKIVSRDIQINDSTEQASNVDSMWNKIRTNVERQNRKFKQNEAQINKISDDINSIQERLAKMNGSERFNSHNSNLDDDYSALSKEIKKIKKEISAIKDNANNLGDESQRKHDTDSIIQRINQISSQQALIVGQYNGLISQFNEIKNELNDLNAKIEENEEKKNMDIELINQKMKDLSENLNEDFISPTIQQRSVSLVDDMNGSDEDFASSSQLAKRVKIIESNLDTLRIRTESGISNQNKLVTQFNELVPQLRQMKDQLIAHILQSQHDQSSSKSRNVQTEEDDVIDDTIDEGDEINSLKSTVSSLRSKVDRIEKGLGTGEEFHPFLNQVRTEVNSLEKEIATIKSNTPDVSTSAFKNQSNQISKLQRQVHTLKRNFEKHLILSSNTGASHEGIALDDEDADSNNFEVSASDDNLSERVTNLESLTKNLTKDNKNIHSTLDRISSILDESVENVRQLSKEINKVGSGQVSLVTRELNTLSSPSKRSVSSPKGDFETDSIDKKLSQLYVQVNSYYSGMGSLSNSVKDLTKKFEQLRNDVNSLMTKSPSSKKSKVNKISKFEKSNNNNNNLSDIDYNDNENSEDF